MSTRPGYLKTLWPFTKVLNEDGTEISVDGIKRVITTILREQLSTDHFMLSLFSKGGVFTGKILFFIPDLQLCDRLIEKGISFVFGDCSYDVTFDLASVRIDFYRERVFGGKLRRQWKCPDVLRSTVLPDRIDSTTLIQDIEEFFRPFSTVNGFPKVKLYKASDGELANWVACPGGKFAAMVHFSPGSHDGAFASTVAFTVPLRGFSRQRVNTTFDVIFDRKNLMWEDAEARTSAQFEIKPSEARMISESKILEERWGTV
jgi:hypothetical protein